MMEENGNGSAGTLEFDEEMCERYLFGELSEVEQEAFETAYFNDDAFFERFAAVKSELLDLYARGELDDGKRARMEPHFLATAPRRKRIAESSEFIRAVTTIADRDGDLRAGAVIPPAIGWLERLLRFLTLPRLAAAAAGLIVLAGGLWLVGRFSGAGETERAVTQRPAHNSGDANVKDEMPLPMNSNGDVARSEVPAATNTPPINERPKSMVAARRNERQRVTVVGKAETEDSPTKSVASDQPDPGTFTVEDSPTKFVASDQPDRGTFTVDDPKPSLTLYAGSTRDAGTGNTLSLKTGDVQHPVTIALMFRSESYPKYVVTISDVDGRELSKSEYEGAAAPRRNDGSRRLVVRMDDGPRLTAGDYIVKLEGRTADRKTETIDEYYFNVKRVQPGDKH